MSIATELQKLNLTKEQIKTVLETPYNVFADFPALIKKYVDNQPTKTVTDGICDNAVPLPAKMVTVDGNNKQETTKGYQLLNTTDTTTNYIEEGKTFIAKDNGAWNVNSNTDWLWLNVPNLTLKSGKTYTLVRSFDGERNSNFSDGNESGIGLGYNETHKTITMSKDVTITTYQGALVQGDNYFLIYEGEYDSSKTFEKYTGGQASPNINYRSDVEVIDGVNLSNLHSVSTINGGYINKSCGIIGNVEKGKTYILAFKNNTAYTNNLGVRTYINDSYSNEITNNITANSRNIFKFTATQTGELALSSKVPEDVENIFTEISLTKGTSLKPYLPYGHIGLEHGGINKAKLELGIIDKSTGVINYGVDGNVISNKLYRELGNTLYFWNDGTSRVRNIFKYSNKNEFLGYSTASNYTFENNVDYIILDGGISSTDRFSVSDNINQTSYEPYHEPTIYPINLDGNSIVALRTASESKYYIKDKLKIYRNGKIEIDKKISEKVTLDGTQGYVFPNGWFAANVKNNAIENAKLPAEDWTYIGNIMCNRLKTDSQWGIVAANRPGVAIAAESHQVFMKFEDGDNADGKWNTETVNQFFKENETYIIYQLKDPQTIALPPIESIELFEGTNTFKLITNIETNFSVEYVVDKNYLEVKEG